MLVPNGYTKPEPVPLFGVKVTGFIQYQGTLT